METQQYPSCVADGDLQLGMRLYKPLAKKMGLGPRAEEWTAGCWAAGREVGRGPPGRGPAFSKTAPLSD